MSAPAGMKLNATSRFGVLDLASVKGTFIIISYMLTYNNNNTNCIYATYIYLTI